MIETGHETGARRQPAALALVRWLEARGVERIWCVPGESYLPLLDALLDSRIELIVCRHESGAGYAALGDAIASGRPGVYAVSRGPGATNGSIAVHAAKHDGVPLVMLVGQVARHELGRHAFQEVDYRQTFGDLAKWVTQVDDPARLVATMARAFDIATGGMPGPVVVALPEDLLEERVEPAALPEPERAGLAVDAATLASVAERLAGAARPLVIGGNLINNPRGRAALARVVRGYGVPVVTEFRQQDLYPNADPLYAGHLGFKIPAAQCALFAEADLLLAAGTDLGDVSTQGYTFPRAPLAAQPLLIVYPDAQVMTRVYRPELACVADPVAFLEALAGHAPPAPPARAGWIARLGGYLETIRRRDRPPPSDGVSFGEVVAALDRQLADDAILVVDSGNFNTWTQRHLLFRGAQRMIGTKSGAMGLGVPGAIACALRHPRRQVVALVGDGCMLMTGGELATAIQYGAKPRLFVADNGSYGTIRLHQEKRYPGRVSGTALRNPDFAALARAHGALGLRIDAEDEVERVVGEALAADAAVVVHVRTSLQRLSAYTTLSAAAGGRQA